MVSFIKKYRFRRQRVMYLPGKMGVLWLGHGNNDPVDLGAQHRVPSGAVRPGAVEGMLFRY
jgi:hypothetical protein